MKKLLFVSIIVVAGFNQCSGRKSSAKGETEDIRSSPGIVYSNPRVYNVDYCFEMFPDPNKIDRAKDLKVWIPMPREWDSQKAVKIISVQPEPHGRYVDPDYGNPMLYWDFGKEPPQTSYRVEIKYRLESYQQVDVEVDPNRVGSYDKTSKEYAVYTRSTHTIHITPKIKELAQEAIGDETNPYLQAKQIADFARKKIRYRILDPERGRGIDCLLGNPVRDEKTGEEYYEGACNQKTALMVALCRAVGIPSRCVQVNIGCAPWIGWDDAMAHYPFETRLSPEGLAATQMFGGLDVHTWGEFFIPNYGWIPADPTWGVIGYQNCPCWITCKGRDVKLGPHVAPDDGSGYGVNWVALHDGRADAMIHGVLNIAKIHTSKATVLHHSDPFPADGLAGYLEKLSPAEGAETAPRVWRQKALRWPSCLARSSASDAVNAEQFYAHYLQAKEERDIFVCHMLRRQLGDEKFFQLAETYLNLRLKSGRAVPISRFRELAEDISGQSLDWFFHQWVDRKDVPRLILDEVSVRKDDQGWQVQGCLRQLGDTTFRLPIELALDTEHGREIQKLWMDSEAVSFTFHTLSEPHRLAVDPECEVLKAQKMAPHLRWFMDLSPKIIVVYGTLGETEANKAAAEQFHSRRIYLTSVLIKADTDVKDTDLKGKYVFLIGRPETNKIAQQFQNLFPIKFDKNTFTWQGVTFARAAQGVTQVVENPRDAGGLIIMLAGVSPEATDMLGNMLSRDSSYFISDRYGQLFAGDWDLEDDAPGVIEWSHKVATDVDVYRAAWSGDLTSVKPLIQPGSDVNRKDESAWTPLHWAVRGQQEDVAAFLIAKGADVNTKGGDARTPLHLAAREGYKEIVELLLENGADVNTATQYDSRTAAEFAISGNHNEIAELLISKGADISPLYFAIHLKDEAKARRLIEDGADVNQRTPCGWTPLVKAADTGLKGLVELLIDKGADVNAKGNWDWTPLHSAAEKGYQDMVELLIANGADVNARDGGGMTPLYYAKEQGRTEIVELLKKHGAKE